MRDPRKKNEHTASCGQPSHASGINDRLIINLRDISHTMRFLYEGKGSQKRILIVLDEIGGSAAQRELTEHLGIQPGSVSEVIAKLENAGCIRRSPNEADRRTVDVVLTDQGKVLAAEAREQRIRRHKQMFSCLSETEKIQLLSLLEKVNADWKEHCPNTAENHTQDKYHPKVQRNHKDQHVSRGE